MFYLPDLSWKFTKSIKRIFLKNLYFGMGKAPLRISGLQAFVLIRIPVIKIPSVFISRLQFAF